MLFDLDGANVHALTGGPDFDFSLPCIVFLHGAGMDATVWSLQTRWFAHHGFAVLALDLPGHGRSNGPPLSTIEAMADWVVDVLKACSVPHAVVVGHSMGSLVALALAARHDDLVTRLILIGTALEMKVGPELLDAAASNSADAVAMVNLWGHGPRAGLGGCETPGAWMAGSGQRLLQQARPGVLLSDLKACNSFNGNEHAPKIRQSVAIFQGTRDMMTPLKGARMLALKLSNAEINAFDGAGHMLMIEEGGAVLSALANAIRATEPVA